MKVEKWLKRAMIMGYFEIIKKGISHEKLVNQYIFKMILSPFFHPSGNELPDLFFIKKDK